MFQELEIRAKITLNTTDLLDDINTVIYDKIVKYYEGKCSEKGYIKKGSVKLLQKSPGRFIKEHFNAHISYDTKFSAMVCDPPINSIIKFKVVAKNQMGLKCEYVDDGDIIIEAYVPVSSAGSIRSERDIESINENEEVYVKVLTTDIKLNEPSVVVIGPVVLNDAQNTSNTDGDVRDNDTEKDEDDVEGDDDNDDEVDDDDNEDDDVEDDEDDDEDDVDDIDDEIDDIDDVDNLGDVVNKGKKKITKKKVVAKDDDSDNEAAGGDDTEEDDGEEDDVDDEDDVNDVDEEDDIDDDDDDINDVKKIGKGI